MEIMSSRKQNIIYGAGENGKRIFLQCIKAGIYIKYFCDCDHKKQEIKLFNKKIVSPEYVKSLPQEFNVIVAIEDNEIQKQIIDDMNSNQISCISCRDIPFIPSVIGSLVDATRLYRFIFDSKRKKVIIYGVDNQAREILFIAQYLDIDIAYIVENNEFHSGGVYGKKIKDIYDLSEETDNIMVLVTASHKADYKMTLDSLGLKETISYILWDKYARGIDVKVAYDPLLGYSRMHDNDQICRKKEKVKEIVILGGSTSDPNSYAFPCWADMLKDKLISNGYKVNIDNEACAGYISSQEMIKFFRDLLPLKPDMVIIWSGINDAAHSFNNDEVARSPFVSLYQQELAKIIASEIDYSNGYIDTSIKYNLGMKDTLSLYEQWNLNQQVIKTICEKFGICHLCFLQPCLATIDNYTNDEVELILNTGIDKQIEYVRKFYSEAKENNTNNAYIDATKIFEGIENIYMDICHVWETGNYLIANYVYEIIMERFLCIF